jgi:signal transduction histidine kinase
MLVFILIVCISVIFVPCFSEDADQVTEGFRLSLYLMNVITPFMVIFLASRYFFNGLIDQRKKNLSLLKSTREKNIRIRQSLKKEKELGELKSSFVSTASHQFRTPLAIIQSNSELLQILSNNLDEETGQRYKKVTGRITGEIGKMTELMDDVLILGKLTSGSVDFRMQELNLADFCKKLAKEFNDVQPGGRIMNIITDGEPYNVYLDPKLLNHSLSNLFSNAFKYSSGKGNPKLTISFISKGFSLTIEDYGMGIPKSEMPNLFHPFFRANNVTEIKGTGLGLSIAKEYFELNKGILTASSTEGIGSTFEINFKKQEL